MKIYSAYAGALAVFAVLVTGARCLADDPCALHENRLKVLHADYKKALANLGKAFTGPNKATAKDLERQIKEEETDLERCRKGLRDAGQSKKTNPPSQKPGTDSPAAPFQQWDGKMGRTQGETSPRGQQNPASKKGFNGVWSGSATWTSSGAFAGSGQQGLRVTISGDSITIESQGNPAHAQVTKRESNLLMWQDASHNLTGTLMLSPDGGALQYSDYSEQQGLGVRNKGILMRK